MLRWPLIVALILMQLAVGDGGAVCSCDQTGISFCWFESSACRSQADAARCCLDTAGDCFEGSRSNNDCSQDSALSSADETRDSADVRSDSSGGRQHRKMPRHLAFSRARGVAVGAAFGRAILAAPPVGPVLTSGEFEQVVEVVRPPRAMDSRMAWLSTVVIRC